MFGKNVVFFLKKPCLKFDRMTQTLEGIFFYLLYFTGLGDTVLGLQMASFAIIGLTTTSTIWFICCKQDDDEDNPEGCQWYLVDALFVYIQSQVLSLEEWLFLLIKSVSISRGCVDAMNIHVSSLTLFCVYTPQLILGHL